MALRPLLPVFELKGGPYDGLVSRQDQAPITGVHFLPAAVIVSGEHGSATYRIVRDEAGDYAEWTGR